MAVMSVIRILPSLYLSRSRMLRQEATWLLLMTRPCARAQLASRGSCRSFHQESLAYDI